MHVQTKITQGILDVSYHLAVCYRAVLPRPKGCDVSHMLKDSYCRNGSKVPLHDSYTSFQCFISSSQ